MSKRLTRKFMRNAQGFTLVELMVVILIIGILASIVAPKMVARTENAKRAAAKAQIQYFKTALISFRMDTGEYPTTQQGLDALVRRPSGYDGKYQEGGYLDSDSVPLDPWRNPYVYLCPGINNPTEYDLESYGRDGRDGGEGDNKDIESWHLQED